MRRLAGLVSAGLLYFAVCMFSLQLGVWVTQGTPATDGGSPVVYARVWAVKEADGIRIVSVCPGESKDGSSRATDDLPQAQTEEGYEYQIVDNIDRRYDEVCEDK